VSDNIVLNAMSGGDTCAADDIGGVKYQRFKVAYGADGSASDVSASAPLPVVPTPAVGGGWSVSSQTALTNTDVAIKASAGLFGGYMVYNPNTVACYIQLFDIATASVTVGTTTPTYVLPIPAASAANLELSCGIDHATAITVAATTTATGGTTPTTALVCVFFYK
jgi:hypothetical protein